MEFIVSRTSGTKDAPCNGATLFKFSFTQIGRQCHTFEEFDERYGLTCGKWTDDGENHRINSDGFIERAMYKPAWRIEINSLEELLKLQSECGEELIISPNGLNDSYYDIEIYDDWRE
ncbi:MAG: hypothetical protein OSJ43_11485 [Oscillospiraceae bacterium]|nr:hypothetical protein [Oscillospiraceae bacterium]